MSSIDDRRLRRSLTRAQIDFAVLLSLKVCREVRENRARSGR